MRSVVLCGLALDIKSSTLYMLISDGLAEAIILSKIDYQSCQDQMCVHVRVVSRSVRMQVDSQWRKWGFKLSISVLQSFCIFDMTLQHANYCMCMAVISHAVLSLRLQFHTIWCSPLVQCSVLNASRHLIELHCPDASYMMLAAGVV